MFLWRRLLKRRVYVALKDPAGEYIEGVLWRRTRGLLVLKSARYFPAGLEHGTPMDGDVLIERSNVAHYQFFYGAGRAPRRSS